MRSVAREERWMVTPVRRVTRVSRSYSRRACDPLHHDHPREPVLDRIRRIRGKVTFVDDTFAFGTQPIVLDPTR
jgi:hypothetical protein